MIQTQLFGSGSAQMVIKINRLEKIRIDKRNNQNIDTDNQF